MTRNLVTAAALGLLIAGPALAGPTPAQKCESGKNKRAGKYGYCRQKAESKYAITGDVTARTTAFQMCLTKYDLKWRRLEAKAVAAGGACPSTGDQTAIQQYLDTATTNVATALAGGTLPDCDGDLLACQGALGTCNGGLRDCTTDLAACDGDLTSCQGSLATAQASLTSCTTDLGTCTGSLIGCNHGAYLLSTYLRECNGNLSTCQNDLTACQAAPQGQRLKTGQTTCWDPTDTTFPIATISCAGTGQDGDLQKGLARAYVDNGDGTITDTKTGLTWEKLSDDGSLHDEGDAWSWSAAFGKVAVLNLVGFAGHTDWRVPNVNELQSLVNYGADYPAVPAAFNTGCAAGCTVLTCSCTEGLYWSSSSSQNDPQKAWAVDFYEGEVIAHEKTYDRYVRAVRGGS